MGDDAGNGSKLAALTLLATTLLGAVGYLQERQQVEPSRGQLAVAQQEAATARKGLKVAEGELDTKNRELQTALVRQQGAATARREAARELLVSAQSAEDRRQQLRDFVSELRPRAAKSKAGDDYYGPTVAGLAEDMVFLRGAIADTPTRLDVSGIDMHGLYMHGWSMEEIDLANSDLRAVDLSRGDWRNATFDNADLTCATFRHSVVSGASIDGAQLAWADLRGVDLADVPGLTAPQLRDIDYDGDTNFPKSVNIDDIGQPIGYPGAAQCARAHIPKPAALPSTPAPAIAPTIDGSLMPTSSPSLPTNTPSP
jgi:uncharacterized protein YjbI with pentapeptide repeats